MRSDTAGIKKTHPAVAVLTLHSTGRSLDNLRSFSPIGLTSDLTGAVLTNVHVRARVR